MNKINVCSVCGCTDLKACPGGCFWIDKKKTVCSKCFLKEFFQRNERTIRSIDEYILDLNHDKQKVLLCKKRDNFREVPSHLKKWYIAWDISLAEAWGYANYGIDTTDDLLPDELITTLINWIIDSQNQKNWNYKILTEDGQVARKKATRPYVAGFINRDLSGKVVKVKDLTTKPKSKFYYAGQGWSYEKLIPEVI